MKSDGERWLLHGPAPQRYEQYKVPRLFRPLAESFLRYVGVRPGECLLDVACGTGIVARLAAPLVGPSGRVVGIDLNPQMLAVAAACMPPDDVIEWNEADAEALPFRSGTFDTVLCQQGLQFFPAPARALGEMRRVLVRDGRIALNVWGARNPYLHALARSLRIHVSVEAAVCCLSPLALGDGAVLSSLLHSTGFSQVDVRITTVLREVGNLRETLLEEISDLPFAAEVCRAGAEGSTRMAEAMIGELEPYRSASGFIIPTEAYFIAARAP